MIVAVWGLLGMLAVLALIGCKQNKAERDPRTELSQERAIEIARTHVSFSPKSIVAEKAVENGRPVWRITFHGEPVGGVHPIGEVMVVNIDRRTGELVALATS